MNFWIDGKRDELIKTLAKVDILIINEAEVRQLANEPNLIRAAAIVRSFGPRTLVVKRGEYGVLMFGEGSVFSAPAYPMEEVSTRLVPEILSRGDSSVIWRRPEILMKKPAQGDGFWFCHGIIYR